MKRIEQLKWIKDLPNNKVEVEDTKGLRWIVGKENYQRFRHTGFLHVANSLTKEFHFILGGRNFGELSDKEKAKVITQILETATKEPITTILPNLEDTNEQSRIA